MKISLNAVILGLSLFLNRGIMAEQSHDPLSQNWVTIKDDGTGLKADFPHHPLEITLDVPFQNIPPKGQIHVYSVPTQKGLLALCTFRSSTLKDNELSKESLNEFFETILVPHFFFNPSIFQDHQIFDFTATQFDGHPASSFQFSFQDHEVVKQLKGIALIKDQNLYIPFYLASKNDFDPQILKRFLKSIQIQTDQ